MYVYFSEIFLPEYGMQRDEINQLSAWIQGCHISSQNTEISISFLDSNYYYYYFVIFNLFSAMMGKNKILHFLKKENKDKREG